MKIFNTEKKGLKDAIKPLLTMLGVFGLKLDTIVQDASTRVAALQEQYGYKVILLLQLTDDERGFELQFFIEDIDKQLHLLHIELIDDFDSAIANFENIPKTLEKALHDYELRTRHTSATSAPIAASTGADSSTGTDTGASTGTDSSIGADQ